MGPGPPQESSERRGQDVSPSVVRPLPPRKYATDVTTPHWVAKDREQRSQRYDERFQRRAMSTLCGEEVCVAIWRPLPASSPGHIVPACAVLNVRDLLGGYVLSCGRPCRLKQAQIQLRGSGGYHGARFQERVAQGPVKWCYPSGEQGPCTECTTIRLGGPGAPDPRAAR